METFLTTSIKTEGWTSHMKRHLEERDEKIRKDTKRHGEERHEKTQKDTERHEKTRKMHWKMRKDRVCIDNRLFYLAWNNNHCCQLTSFGRKSEPKVRLKPF